MLQHKAPTSKIFIFFFFVSPCLRASVFPNKKGIRNSRKWVQYSEAEKDNYNSWIVRYYTIDEYKQFFSKIFGNFDYRNHSFIGIGILPSDLKYIPFPHNLPVLISLFGSGLTKVFPFLTKYSDSIYINAQKQLPVKETLNVNLLEQEFMKLHAQNPNNNLNIVHLLRCPQSGNSLVLSDDKTKLVNEADRKLRGCGVDGVSLEPDAPLVGAIDAGQNLDEGGLARSILP